MLAAFGLSALFVIIYVSDSGGGIPAAAKVMGGQSRNLFRETGRQTKRNETKMGEMLNSRNRNETQNNPNAHFAKPKRNTKQVRCPPCSLLAKRNETKRN